MTAETLQLLLGTLMIVATLLPLARLDDWWVRIFDFPRLQIAAISALVLARTLLRVGEIGGVQRLHTRHFRLVEFRRLRHWGSDHFSVFIKLSHEPDAAREQEVPHASAGEQQEAREKIDKAT